MAGQRDLAGHGQVGPHRTLRERRHQARPPAPPRPRPRPASPRPTARARTDRSHGRPPRRGHTAGRWPEPRRRPRGPTPSSRRPATPVRVSSPRPDIRPTSTNSPSTPYGVHRSAPATSGSRTRFESDELRIVDGRRSAREQTLRIGALASLIVIPSSQSVEDSAPARCGSHAPSGVPGTTAAASGRVPSAERTRSRQTPARIRRPIWLAVSAGSQRAYAPTT